MNQWNPINHLVSYTQIGKGILIYNQYKLDSDGALVYYLWNWGDGNISGWLGHNHCGVTCQAKHTWTKIHTYNITVKAKDVMERRALWSDPLSITIPYSYKPIFQFLELCSSNSHIAFPLLQKLLDTKKPFFFIWLYKSYVSKDIFLKDILVIICWLRRRNMINWNFWNNIVFRLLRLMPKNMWKVSAAD